MTGRRRRLTTTTALALGGLLLAIGARADHGHDRGRRDAPRLEHWVAGAGVVTRDGWLALRVDGGDDAYRHRLRRLPVVRGNRYHYHHDGHRRGLHVPPGHRPPPGLCKVWYPGVPPGHQPPSTACWRAERMARRTGGTVIYGERACRH